MMRIEVRSDRVIIDGYVNAVARDSRVMKDRSTGQRFVEQIRPGAFKRALERNEVQLLLNHDENKHLGSTETNLTLYEDSIGLRAHAEVTDAEVIQKARDKKLRGWSFGFLERDVSEEDINNGLKRRFVEDLELKEVSIIDERKIPCYDGTSLELRAEGKEILKGEVVEVRATYVENNSQKKEPIDYTKYTSKIKELEERKR